MLTDMQVIVRLLLAVVLSGLIGLERQFHKRTAGLRTHILVSLGSCLIMLTSLYVFDIYSSKVPLDPTRIAAGVITGIGFLGAGTIIRDREGIRGLTTAASLWAVAGIGMAVGCGFYVGAVFTSVLVLVVLFFLRYIENIVFDEQKKAK
ncbi:MAG: MgtC/SapB family protein [Candidatus Omnitrophica bacterium]|nr:MgtC/SapB family protein [Candidatus Omnitrophota bacterium]MBU1868926.1 MgtC/SapB family protein [Candidatus Omnitrophota bacterium]